MSLDAGSGGLAKVHAEIESLWAVEALKDLLGKLGQADQFMGGFGGQGSEAVEVGVGHDHDVAGGIREGVEADKTVLSAVDEAAGGLGLAWIHAVGNGEVDGSDEVAEDAAEVAGPGGKAGRNAGARGIFRRGDVGKAPRGPEIVHMNSEGCAVPNSIEGCPHGSWFVVLYFHRSQERDRGRRP